MAYQALYRKYRPHTFEDFIDQDLVKKILVNSIANNKISHAYLFSGPRGIGKTSMAKIFAKAINCANFSKKNDVCDKCDNCIECDNSVDIVEIDAASNNGVDQIRELKNKISIVPSKLKYKVYIVDEVHMLTNSAFNALLKTLEEPPSYVVFILATTEFYEVPETIVSRCQCFNFTRISEKSLVERLKMIAKKEKISIDDDAIVEIAKYSNGGLRDAIGMLDKLNSFTSEKITLDIFKSINGMISTQDIIEFYNHIFENNVSSLLEIIERIDKQGYDYKNFVERLMIYVRDCIMNYYVQNGEIKGNVDDNIELVSVLNDILNRLKQAINPKIIVQIFLLKYLEGHKNISREIKKETKVEEKVGKKENDNVENAVKEVKKPKEDAKSQLKIDESVKNVRINNSMATANLEYKKELNLIWKKLEKYFMDDKYGKISQLLSDAVPMVVGSDYAIFVASSNGLINNIYANLLVAEDFIKNIYRKLSIVIVREEEFDAIKNKYIEDKKNKIEYKVQEECGKLVIEENSLINQAIDLFGSDLVEIE